MKSLDLLNQGVPKDFFSLAKEILRRQLSARGCQMQEGAHGISLRLDQTLPGDSYAVSPRGEIRSGSAIGLLAGMGQYLREGSFDGEGDFIPCGKALACTPRKSIRGMYFATHFFNFYHAAPLKKVYEVIESLALWGCNAIMVWYDMHHFSSIEEVHSLKMLERLKSILGYAKTLGMKACMIVGANEAFSGTPENIKADWRAINGYKTEPVAHYHLEICPHRPEGMEELMAQHRKVLQAFSGVGVDYIVLWPYDQGGCTCEKCVPWGANGFLDIALEYRKVVEQELPGTQIICSTWGFDRFVDGEWEAFYQRMKEPAFQFFSHLLGYFVPGEKIPPFLLRGDVPGGKEMLSFSEISMQDAVPWGGFGANPRPSAMERDEREYGRYYKGNFPYSEGIFEDVNKVLTLGFANGRYDSAYSILLDYIRYEFCTPHPEAVAELMYDMEETLPRHRVTSDGRIADWCTKEISSDTEFHFVFTNPEKIDSVYRRALQINASLPKNLRTCWRWRILYLRAAIDYHLFHASGTATPQCEEFYEELIQLYHAQNADYCVFPPTREAMRQNRGQVVL